MSKEICDAALEILKVDDVTVEVFFVQRKARQLDKKKDYAYKITKIDVDKGINDFFLEAARAHINQLLATERPVSFLNYAVITDDLPDVCLTYTNSDSLSVAEKTWKKIESQTDINRLSNLTDIKGDLWYYCVSFLDTHEIGDPRLLFFRKTSSSAVATDSTKGVKNWIRAQLSTSDPKLVKMTDETISFDNTFDCLLFGENFLIKEKQRFEKIAEIEEEFVEHSKAAIQTFKEMDIIEGLDFLEIEITGKPSMMRILANIVKNENNGEISESKILSMRKTLLEHEGRELKMNADGNKLLIQDKEDTKDLLNLLNDYYKEGMTSGKTYGSNAGRILKRNKN